MNKDCLRCGEPLQNSHANRKRCEPCAAYLRKRPVGELTPAQVRQVKLHAGTMFAHKLAEKIGVSRSRLRRWARDNSYSLNALKYPEHVVQRVCDYYTRHGKKKTIERFPNIKVRSIFERYNKKPRQARWKQGELLEAYRMAGLVSPHAQAKFFQRPNAHVGSIKSLWAKKLRGRPTDIHGLTHDHAKHIVTQKARYLRPIGIGRSKRPTQFRRMILWVDLEKCLKPATPKFIKQAVQSMAEFQRWLWQDQNPKPLILKMIKEREHAALITTRKNSAGGRSTLGRKLKQRAHR